MRLLVAAVILAIAAVSPVQAFNELGHKVVAKIAYDRLSEAQRTKVFEILSKHPHYAEYLSADRPADADPKEWAFLNASVWSDWIRPPEGFPFAAADADPRYKFHRGNWHYINYPYTAHQTTFTLGEPLWASSNILQQLDLCETYLKGTATDDPGIASDVTPEQNRAVRLCWLAHLVGDLHQPLHAVALVEPGRLEKGDQGGNLLAIKESPDANPVRLHLYWDSVLGYKADYATIAALAKEIVADQQLAPSGLTELSGHPEYRDWAQESYELAGKIAYQNGDLPVVLWRDSRDQDESLPQHRADADV